MLHISNGLNNRKRRTDLSRFTTTFTSGSSDYVVVANHADLQVTDTGGANDFSIAFWIKLTVDASSTSNLDGYIGMKAGAFRGHGFYMRYDDAAGDDESIQLVCNTGSASQNVSTDTDLVHDNWYHIAATFDQSATTGKIYVDGSLSATNASLNVPTQYTGDIHIGSSNTDSEFVSSITSELVFWKGTVLDAESIFGLTEASQNLKYFRPAPTAYWKFNEDSATGSNNVIDEMGTHHGTSSGLADADFDTAGSSTGV